MITITFNAFSFVRKKLKKQNIPYLNASVELQDDSTPRDLMNLYYLDDNDVEFVFVNSKVLPKDTKLRNGDRIAFVPPGTPGSYRLLLGAKKVEED
jgi:molybdopterin converting factor small subunit